MITYKGSKTAILKLQQGIFTQVFIDAMATQLRAAAAAWVKEVLKNVPIYTGAAKGTFEPLTRVLRRFDVSNPYTSPINARAKRKVETGTIIQGTKYDLGYYGAQKYGQTFFEIPKSVILSSGITFTFAFSNDLPYMLWNDIYPAPVWMNMPSNPPWDYINKGIEAFKNYVDLELPKYIPGIEPYISVQVVSVR